MKQPLWLGTLALAGWIGAAGAAAADHFDLGRVVVGKAGLVVRAEPSLDSPPLATHAAGILGTIGSLPVLVDDKPWYEVDFEGGLDGWVLSQQFSSPYFPLPESAGGWRSLVTLGKTPSASQKATIRSRAGIDWNKLKLAADYSRSFTSSSTVLVIRNGYVTGEWGSRSALGVASVSKSLTGLEAAKLFELSANGGTRFAPTDPAYLHLPDTWDDGAPEKRAIKLQDLMTMTSGLLPHDNPGASGYLGIVLDRQVAAPPGRQWAYSSLPVDLLSVAIQRTTGRSLRALFNEHIAAPLGIPALTWGTFGSGSASYTGASSKAEISARNLARIGYLMMMHGRWNDGSANRQILQPQSVDMLLRGLPCGSDTEFTATPGSPFPVSENSALRYGHLWWSQRTAAALGPDVPRDAFYAHGYRETLLVVVPSRNLVVVRNGPEPKALASFRVEFMRRVMAAVTGPVSTRTAPGVDRIEMIDADADKSLALCGPIPRDPVIDLATVPTQNLNIAATLLGGEGQSVAFDLDGTMSIDSTPPFSLVAGVGDDYPAWTPSPGEHRLAVTPYGGPGGTGPRGATTHVTFTVLGTSAAAGR